ncbi:MAG TPA: hypothetical protein VMQ62_10800, partial [Dongiaceae bacterium]|nr:hypothetical protein [Dongiaceae bacterium]
MRWRSRLAAGCLALGLLAASPAAREIRPGESLLLHLASGGSERFRMPLRADRPVRVVADQLGLDVSLELTSPAGEVIETVADRSSGLEVLVAIVPKSGSYGLEVAAASEKLPAGDVDLRIEEFRDTPEVRAAARLHQEARAIAARGKDSRRDARRAFEAARDAWAEAGDESMTAWALEEIGDLSILIPEPVAARLAYAEAAKRFAALGRAADQAVAQYGAGHALHQQGDYAGACAQWKATFDLEGALTPSDRVDLRYAYAADLKQQGEYDEALPIIESALETYRGLGMLTEELTAQAELGSIHLMRRDTVRALDALTCGVARSRETARPDMEARFLQRLAVLEWEIGDRDAAAEQATRALALFRRAGNHVAEGAVLVLLGDVLGRRDDLDGAEANYR